MRTLMFIEAQCSASEYGMGECEVTVERALSGSPALKTPAEIAEAVGYVKGKAKADGWLDLSGGNESLCPNHAKDYWKKVGQ